MMEAKIKQIYSPRLASRRRGLVPKPRAETRRPGDHPPDRVHWTLTTWTSLLTMMPWCHWTVCLDCSIKGIVCLCIWGLHCHCQPHHTHPFFLSESLVTTCIYYLIHREIKNSKDWEIIECQVFDSKRKFLMHFFPSSLIKKLWQMILICSGCEFFKEIFCFWKMISEFCSAQLPDLPRVWSEN